jgi:hypothetical protein
MKRLVTLLMTALLVAGLGISLFRIEPVEAGTVSVSYVPAPALNMTPIVKPISRTGGYTITFNYTVTETIPSNTTPCPFPAPYTCVCSAPDGPGLAITIPNDFPAPSLDANSPGYITSSAGTVYIYNRTAVVYFASMAVGTVVSFTYGNINPLNPLILPSRPNNYTFPMSLRTVCKSSAITRDVPYPSSFIPVTLSPVVKVLSNMTPATAVFNPNTEKQNAEVEISFVTGAGEERSLVKGDKIRIWFDIDPATGMTLPIALPSEPVQVPPSIPPDAITVNNMKCTVAPTITYLTDGGITPTALIDVVIPYDIRVSATSGSVVKVKFAKSALIYTAKGAPYQRTVKVATMNATGSNLIEPIPDNYDNRNEGLILPAPPYPNAFVTGNAYRIGTAVTPPLVLVQPNTASAEATYTIGASCLIPGPGQLLIGAQGVLYQNDGSIVVEFPSGTRIPTAISPGSISISVNGGVPTILSQPPVVSGTKVTFKTPMDIPAGACLQIFFNQSAHIVNPSVGADNYYLKVWTSAEPTVINSANYQITNPGYAAVNVDPPISFTTLLTEPTCAPQTYYSPYECYTYANNDCDTTGAKYVIQFSLNEACPIIAGSAINITFDPKYQWPSFASPNIPANQVIVNNVLCSNAPVPVLPPIRAGNVVTVYSPVDLPAKSIVTITFLPGAGIVNPDNMDEIESYNVGIQITCSNGQFQQILSQPYSIKTQLNNIELVQNWLDDSTGTWGIQYQPGNPYIFQPSVNTITGWRFDFCVGDYGDRLMNRPNLVTGDTVTITFPPGTTFPTRAILNGEIRLGLHDDLIAGLPLRASPADALGQTDFGMENVTVNGTTVSMTVPAGVYVLENSKLTLYFPPALEIRTPVQAGAYVVSMYTSNETTPVISSPFNIGTVVTDIGVTVTPNTSRSIDMDCVLGTSEFVIRFKTGPSGALMAGDLINVIFPYGFTKSDLLNSFTAGTVFVNGVANPNPISFWMPASGDLGGIQLQLPVQDYIAAGSVIEVVFTKQAMIRNPRLVKTPTIYTLQVFTSKEPALQKSLPFTIISKVCMSCASTNTHSVHFWDGAAFTGTSILMGNSVGPVGGGWLVGFQTGDVVINGANNLEGGYSEVTIEFPPRTSVPSYIPTQFIRTGTAVPGTALCGAWGNQVNSVKVNGTKVTLVLPNDVGPVTSVYVYFCAEANIGAPDKPGDHTIKVYTNTEPEVVESCTFLVMPRGMTPAIVTPWPSQAGAPNVKYTIEFTLGMYGALGVGDMINIDFLDNNPHNGAGVFATSIADPQFLGNQIPAMYVTVNDVPCLLPISYMQPGATPFSLHVQTPIAIQGNTRVKIVFSPQCRITNPATPSPWTLAGDNQPGLPNYMVSITTNKEVTPTLSEEYEITPANLPTRPVVINETCVANIPAEYSLSFVTPIQLVHVPTVPPAPPASAYIDIQFPTGFYLPATMAAAAIRVNEYLCIDPPQITGTTVRVYVPITINAWETVVVKFDENLMLYNPQLPGEYRVWINLNGAAVNGIAGKYTVCEQINIARVEILPGGQSNIPLGGTQVFTAKAFNTQGMIINSPNLTFTWTYSNDTGYISPLNGPTTTFTAFKKGDGVLMVAATYGNRTMTSTVPVIVTGTPSSLLINPGGPTTVVKGQCYPFTAQLFDDYSTPHPITSGVEYKWEMSVPGYGTVTPTTGKSTQFCATAEGRAYIICTATYEGSTFTARSEFVVKSGIYSLVPLPAPDLGQVRIGQVTPELMFELRDDYGAPKEATETMVINVESTSTTGMYSTDRLHWTSGPKTSVIITKGFSRSTSFYYTDTSVGNIMISGVAPNINPAFIKINFTGSTSRLRFINEARVAAAGTPSGALTLSIRDDFNQPSPPPSDTLIELFAYPMINGQFSTTPSVTGSFSLSQQAWMPIIDNVVTMRQGQQSLDVYYKDSVVGTYQIKARSMIYGIDLQTLVVTQAGSVGGNLLVSVDRPVALVTSDYHVSFRVGSNGQLQAGLSHIYIQFPKGTEIPAYNQADIKVNTSPTSVIPIVDRQTNVIDIVCPVNVNANGDVVIDLPRMTNPPEGNYTVKIWTSAEASPSTSQSYKIGQSSVSNVIVTLTPNSAGIPSQYVIKFRTGPSGALNKGEYIIVEFPVGTILPAKIEPRYVKIHGIECTQMPEILGLQVKIYNTMPVGPDTEWDVTFEIGANVTNPPVPKNDYKLKVSTKSEPILVDSAPYEITTATTITDFTVKTTPPTVGEKARWELSFKLGANGALIQGDEIYIQMNDETLPTSIAADYVSINGIKPAQDVVVDGKRLKIRLKGGISAGQQVIITIDANAGVRNPDKPGSEYRLSVFTTKEPYAVISNTFTIESSIIVTYSLNPPAPNGKYNWYTVPITVSFDTNVSGDIVWWYEGESPQNYAAPFVITKTGQVILNVKAKSRVTGVESAPKRIIAKYDPNPPKIMISNPPDNSQVKDSIVNITGSIIENESNDVTLTMNGESISLNGMTFAKQVSLRSGLNTIEFRAEDTAGNVTVYNYKIELKNQPPILKIDKPGFLEVINKVELVDVGANKKQLTATVDVSGIAEIGVTQVKITPVTVPGAAQTITVGPDGKFSGSLKFPCVGGQNEYTVEIVDKLGNVNTTKMFVKVQIKFVTQIENKIATLNGSQIQLLAPPYIQKGRTLVPFRILGESFGANVDWDANTRTAIYVLGDTRIELQIGSVNAKIIKGGVTKYVKLDVPAIIKNGSTMVPIRFISENFGARVGWAQATRTVTVDYPAL